MKLFSALVLLVALISAGCGGDGGESETGSPTKTPPAGGTGAVVVKVSYTGTARTTGTGKLFAYLYKSLSTAQAVPDYQASSETEAAVGTEYTLTLNNVAAGDYYLLIVYDSKLHNQHDAGNGDRYVLYNGQHLAGSAAVVAVQAGATTTLSGISFGDEFQLGSGGSFQ